MRGTRRLTLVPSLSVATSSDTGTGLSLTAYFGFAIFGSLPLGAFILKHSRTAVGWAILPAFQAAGPAGKRVRRLDSLLHFDSLLHKVALLQPKVCRTGSRRPTGGSAAGQGAQCHIVFARAVQPKHFRAFMLFCENRVAIAIGCGLRAKWPVTSCALRSSELITTVSHLKSMSCIGPRKLYDIGPPGLRPTPRSAF